MYEEASLRKGVTSRGQWLKALYLDFSELTVFDHHNVRLALRKIYEEYGNHRPRFNLMTMHFIFYSGIFQPTSTTTTKTIMEEVVSLCPRLKIVEVPFDYYANRDVLRPLLKISELLRLCVKFSIIGEYSLDSFFEKGVNPILEHHGTALKYFYL